MSLVLVTGGSGFIGSHCILQLLAAGHQVRALLKVGGAEPGDRLRFFAADLEKDAGWAEAAAGCDFVLHVASPFPQHLPRHENDLIVPAREGTLRALRASRDAGVKRVVVTSSFAAIGYGHEPQSRPFDETDWTNPDARDVAPYAKSKTLAERAAWDFMAREGGKLELSVVNPVGVFGPALGADTSTSIAIIKMMMDGAMPGVPQISFGVVDVRDVADLHLRAMTDPAAKGERFLAVAGDFISFLEVAKIVRAHLGAAARRVPTRNLPNWLLRIAAIAFADVRQIIPELGKPKNATNAKAKRVLGWNPRSNEESIVATAESLVGLGLLKDSAQAR
jgi:nucleoside-diphosphate-sugar epimerase